MADALQVALAVQALVAGALLPLGVTVPDMDGSGDRALSIPPAGLAVVLPGQPSPPEMDLSPPTYNYELETSVALSALPYGGASHYQRIDAMLAAIGTAILADRTLGGMIEYLDAARPPINPFVPENTKGAAIAAGAELILVATYSTTSPC